MHLSRVKKSSNPKFSFRSFTFNILFYFPFLFGLLFPFSILISIFYSQITFQFFSIFFQFFFQIFFNCFLIMSRLHFFFHLCCCISFTIHIILHTIWYENNTHVYLFLGFCDAVLFSKTASAYFCMNKKKKKRSCF